MKARDEVRIEMVCLGNICRSPMAAAVLANRASELSAPRIIVSSSGTSSWHVGEDAHPLSRQVWESNGYRHEHRARQFSAASFDELDLILAMDESNYANIIALADNQDDRKKVAMLRAFDGDADSHEVPDPWGNEAPAYSATLEMVEAAVTGLLKSLRR